MAKSRNADSTAIQSVGRAPAATFDRLAVVYDPDSGEVRHVHRLTSSRKGAKVGEADLRADAIRYAEQFHGRGDLAQAKVALAEVDEWRPGVEHRVDPKGKLCRGRRG